MSKLQVAAIGAVVAAGIAVPVWQQTRLNRLASRNQDLQAQVEELPALRQELAELHQVKVEHAELERLRALQPEVARLRATAHSGRQAQAEAAQLKTELERQKATASTDESSNAASGPMAGLMKGYMEQMLAGRLNQMKQKLNLTPDQEHAIREILVSQADQQAENAQKILSGKMTREEMAKVQKGASQDPEKEIQALLTPEQQTAYTEFKQEEAVSNARLVANAEMLQMQTSLGLSQEQQDKVYGVLYDQYAKQLSGKDVGAKPESTDPTALVQDQFDKKLKALEGILTATQLDSYRQFQEAQMKMIQGFMPKSDSTPPAAAQLKAPAAANP